MKMLGSFLCIISVAVVLTVLHDFLLIVSLYDTNLSWLPGAQFSQYYISDSPFTLMYYGLGSGIIFVLGCFIFGQRKKRTTQQDPGSSQSDF